MKHSLGRALALLAVTASSVWTPSSWANPDVTKREDCKRYRFEQALSSPNRALRIHMEATGEFNPVELAFEVLPNYRQTHYQLVDPMGDYALSVMTAVIPKRMIQALLGKKAHMARTDAAIQQAASCADEFFDLTQEVDPKPAALSPAFYFKPEEYAVIQNLPISEPVKAKMESDYKAGTLNIEGRVDPLDNAHMVQMLLQVIREEEKNGITPTAGQVHRWSGQFLKEVHFIMKELSPVSKLLAALSRGETNKYMYTGHETELTQWILEQPVKSIRLDQMFRRSYQLNQGDVYLSLMTIENALAYEWRITNRLYLPVTIRLKPFQNHFGEGGDDFGDWYHLIGVILYGYAIDSARESKTAGTIEEIGAHLLSGFEDQKQKDYINKDGGPIGAWLKSEVLSGEFLKEAGNPAYVDESYYLRGHEDFTYRLMKLASQVKL